MCNACGCKSAEEFGAEWRGRWDVGNERYDGQNDEFRYYIRKMGNNPEGFQVFIRGRNPEGRELIRQASKNPIFRNLRDADKIKIGFFIRNQTEWEGKIIKGLYQVYLPKLVEHNRGKQIFSMTPSNLIMDNYGESVIEGLYRTKQEAVNAIYYYFEEMEYPFHSSNWPLDMESWYAKYDAEEFGAEAFDETYRMKGATKSLISDVLRKHGYDDFNELESENLKFLLYDVFIEGMEMGMESASYNAEEFGATKGMDTYAQPLEELKIKPTKTKVGILLASIVAGGLWYSNKMKE